MQTPFTLDDFVVARRRERHAVLMLLIACVLWGLSFNWNKEAQAILGQRLAAAATDPSLESAGPAAFLAIRFLFAVFVWAAIFPRCLRGWSIATFKAGAVGGTVLAVGMLLQHYGLAQTTESLSSFLTSLTVLFTPIMAFTVLRHRVGAMLWAAVACATIGVALMTLNREEGRFDRGALLGLLCAVVFSVHILYVDAVGKTESPWRFALGQFAAAAIVFTGYTLWRPGGSAMLSPSVMLEAMNSGPMLLYLALTILFATVGSFGLMVTFQPRTSPTRAALVYLSEPLFATVYAWIVSGRGITSAAMGGALLIVLANALAEFFARGNDKDLHQAS